MKNWGVTLLMASEQRLSCRAIVKGKTYLDEFIQYRVEFEYCSNTRTMRTIMAKDHDDLLFRIDEILNAFWTPTSTGHISTCIYRLYNVPVEDESSSDGIVLYDQPSPGPELAQDADGEVYEVDSRAKAARKRLALESSESGEDLFEDLDPAAEIARVVGEKESKKKAQSNITSFFRKK